MCFVFCSGSYEARADCFVERQPGRRARDARGTCQRYVIVHLPYSNKFMIVYLSVELCQNDDEENVPGSNNSQPESEPPVLPPVIPLQAVVAPREASSAAIATASTIAPSLQPTATTTTTAIRAGGIAPGGSFATRPGSAGSKPPQQSGVRSPILPVQRAPVRKTRWLVSWYIRCRMFTFVSFL